MTGPGTPNNPNPPNTPPANAGQRLRWRAGGRVVQRGTPQPPRYRRPPHFTGQMPNERVVWVRRQSRWFLLASGAPLLLGVAGLALLHFLWLGDTQPLIQVILAAVLGVFILRWLVVDFYNWFFTYYYLTSERVVKVQGFFQRTIAEVVLKNVSQVSADRPNPLYMLFGLGDVEVRPLGPPITLIGVWRPRDLADSILAMQENPNYGLIGAPTSAAPGAGAARGAGAAGGGAGGAGGGAGGGGAPGAAAGAPGPDPSGGRLKSAKLQTRLDELAQPLPMPVATPITRRQWLHFLARRIPIKFFEGEQVIEVVYRHWFILLRNEVIPILILVASIAGGILLRDQGGEGMLVLIGGTVVALVAAYLIYLNWADDVFVLTTHRVIDVDRLLFILEEYSNDAPYARIQEVNVTRSFLGLLLGYGSIRVQTSGRRSAMEMEHIPGAARVMDRIFQQIHLLRERESVSAINKQKKENYKWFASLLNDALTQVPDVRGLGLLEAAGQLRRSGLKMVVLEERHVPGTATGTVLDQQPSADTTALTDSEVRVVLAAQNAPGAQAANAPNAPGGAPAPQTP